MRRVSTRFCEVSLEIRRRIFRVSKVHNSHVARGGRDFGKDDRLRGRCSIAHWKDAHQQRPGDIAGVARLVMSTGILRRDKGIIVGGDAHEQTSIAVAIGARLSFERGEVGR